MSSRRSALLALTCVLEALPCSVACSGNAELGAAGAAGTSAGGSSSAGRGSAAAGASGTVQGGAAEGGASGAAQGGASGAAEGGASGAAQGGAAAGQGGASMAGTAGVAATGGASGCSGLSQTRSARLGKSAGFSGDYVDDYFPLYYQPCSTLADCSAACVTAGGTQTSCAASECVADTPNDRCLPPTYWHDFEQLLTEGNSQESSAQIIMVNNPYRDPLLVSNFQFEIPSGAKILGISFAINEAAGSENLIADYSVRATDNSGPVGLDRGHTQAWTSTFHAEIYGHAADLWGATWNADTVNAPSFGVALTPLYLDTAGNERAYVDFVRATVTYDTCK